MSKIKYCDGTCVRVYWTDSILKIRYDYGKPGQCELFKDHGDDDIWYDCESSEYNPFKSGYYCNTAQNDIIEVVSEKEFLASRKESFEFWLDRVRESAAYYESEIEKINQLLNEGK